MADFARRVLVVAWLVGSSCGCSALVAPDPSRIDPTGTDTGSGDRDTSPSDLDGGEDVDAFTLDDAGEPEDAFVAVCAPECTEGRICVDGACHCPDGECCPGCNADQVCLAGSCAPCGGLNQLCCGDVCVAGDTICLGGRCERCGDPGTACCEAGRCAEGTSCESGTCEGECGGLDETCCAEDRCEPGTVCSGGFPFGSSCRACGGDGQPCCRGRVCTGDGLVCDGGGNCRGCGGLGEPCCPGGSCHDGRRCVFDRCS